MIAGQKIDTTKKKLSRQFRKEMTKAEKILWERLKKNRLAGIHFRRQQVIDRVIVDFYCHQFGLVIEIDGLVHEKQREYDETRDNYLVEKNLKVMRFSNEQDLNDTDGVLENILRACND